MSCEVKVKIVDFDEGVVIVEIVMTECVNMKPSKAMVRTCYQLVSIMCSKAALTPVLIQPI